MPHKTWTRERLTAADLQDYLQDQVVLQFASVSARDAAVATGARKAGMVAFTEADGTYWGCAVDGGVWRALGQIAPPVAVTVNTGWSASSTNPPRVYRSSPNRCRLAGWHSNAGGFTPNATQYPVTVPADYRPLTNQVFVVPFVFGPGAVGAGQILATMLPDGRLRYDSLIQGSTAPNTASVFFLDSVEWHTTYAA